MLPHLGLSNDGLKHSTGELCLLFLKAHLMSNPPICRLNVLYTLSSVLFQKLRFTFNLIVFQSKELFTESAILE